MTNWIEVDPPMAPEPEVIPYPYIRYIRPRAQAPRMPMTPPRYLRPVDAIGKECVGIEHCDETIKLYFAGGLCLSIGGYAYADDEEITGYVSDVVTIHNTDQMEAEVGKDKDFCDYLAGRHNNRLTEEPQIREWRV